MQLKRRFDVMGKRRGRARVNVFVTPSTYAKKAGETPKKSVLLSCLSLHGVLIYFFLGTKRLGFGLFRGPCGGGGFFAG